MLNSYWLDTVWNGLTDSDSITDLRNIESIDTDENTIYVHIYEILFVDMQ